MRRKTPQEITIEIMKNSHGIKIDKLICGKYAGVGLVLDTGYKYAEDRSPSDYNADNPTGYETGQWITVRVIEGAMGSHRKGAKIEGIWSYGGDTGIIGKPQIGDIVGFYYGHYAKLWEKLTPLQVRIWKRMMGSSGATAQQKSLREYRRRRRIYRDRVIERSKAAAQQKLSAEYMQNSSIADRLGSIIIALFLLALGLAIGFSVVALEWLDGSFPWWSIFMFLVALGLVSYAGWKLYCHIIRFSEKPVIIRGMVSKKSAKITRTVDDTGGVDESTSYYIKVGKDEFSVKEKVYDWLNIGDVVDLTYFQSIDEVTWVHKIAKTRIPQIFITHKEEHY
jgi:hypothetical protein